MAIPITWDSSGTKAEEVIAQSSGGGKLKKKKSVRFTPIPDGPTDEPITPIDEGGTGLPTPDTTPESIEKKAKKGLFARFRTNHPRAGAPPSPPGSDDEDTDTWQHHASYFPEYEPINPRPGNIPGVPGVVGQNRYFPEYTPLTQAGFPSGTSGAYAYALDPAQALAAGHSERIGHSVVVHYPDLPKFADYQGDGKNKWQSGQHGIEGWNGFGWEGEKLPNQDGQTFGAPMPPGQPLPVEEKEQGGGGGGGGGKKKNKSKNKNKNKNKQGGGGGGGGGVGGGGDDDEGDEGGGDEGGGDDE